MSRTPSVKMRVVFMGSPEFAVPCLRALHAHHEVALVVSQPDKPAGRGGQLTAPAVKTAALELGLAVAQPRSARTGELRDAMAATGAELAVVVAYGKILPLAVLEALPRGCINVHGSLLPRYRGAAPVQRAVIDGEAETGVSIMQLDEGMDTGPVYLERRTPIGEDETAGELMARLAPVGAEALLEAIAAIAGGARPVAQDHDKATHAAMLDKPDGVIDFARPAAAVAARIRGVDPWPGAQAVLRGQPIKLFRALSVEGRGEPGTVLAIDGTGVHVAAADGAVVIRDVQAAGRKRMAAAQFAAGRGIAVGDVLGQAGVTSREVARRVLDRVDKGGAWATLSLDGELGRAGLDERDRRLCAELVYGVLRQRARLDHALGAHADLKRTPARVVTALRLAAYQLLFLDRVPGYAAVDDAVDAARAAGGAKLAGFCNAVLRKLATGGEPPLPAEPRARLEVEHSLPGWIVDELIAAAGPADDVAALAAAFARPAPIIARVNPLRATREAVIDELTAAGVTATPIAEAPMAIALDGVGDPARSPGFLAGRWTVQDTGAQHVGLAAAPRPGLRILDACAGVGGKSTHLAELANDEASIDAADQSSTKLALAAQTAQRLGLRSIQRQVCDLLDPDAPLGRAYDLIVLDAPCTGLGVLRRHPDAKWRLVANDVPRLAKLQRMLLDAVVPRLAPGGALVYSVCTFTRAEGPDQIAALAARTGLRVVAEQRTWPPDGDAFYLARLER